MFAKNVVCTILICIVLSANAFSQSAAYVLEEGISIEKGQKIFLIFENGKIKTDIGVKPRNPLIHPDSTLFLVPDVGINVYMRPVNPLTATHKDTLIMISDPVDDAAKKTLQSIIALIEPMLEKGIPDDEAKGILSSKDVNQLMKMNSDVNSIAKSLENDYLGDIAEIFSKLTKISFETIEDTKEHLKETGDSIATIKNHFESLNKSIAVARDSLAELKFPYNQIYEVLLSNLETIKSEQEKHLNKLEQIYKLVEDYQKRAKKGADGVPWVVKLGTIPAKQGEISQYSIRLNSGEFTLVGNDEKPKTIQKIPSKEILSHTIRVRKFQRYVPEVAAGIAYTFISHTVYGTDTDEAGRQVIAEAGKNDLNNVNFTAMLNFNYFKENSNVHPFWQVGVGVNKDVPTLLSGLGVRINISGLRFALSGGLALTWVEQLNNLEVGDEISGTAELKKDLKHQILWPPRAYAGIQLKF